VRKLTLILLAMLAARMAKRALARGAGQYAEIMAALWQVTGLLLTASTGNTPKTRNIEDRLNALVPRIPVPQSAPGTSAGGTSGGSNSSYGASNSSYTTSNSSYGMGGGTSVTYVNTGVGNGGVGGATTSGQVGGAAAHYHTMAHAHTSSGDLEAVFNALRDSHSNLVPAFNTLRDSHSNLVPAVNALQASHSNLVPVVNNLVSDHGQLITDHNNLKTALMNSGVLH
jgi:hypothetical protein